MEKIEGNRRQARELPATLGDMMRGPFVKTRDVENGPSIIDYMEAIDYHVMPSLVVSWSQLIELINGLEQKDMEEASDYLIVMQNAIMILARIQEEGRQNSLKGGANHE